MLTAAAQLLIPAQRPAEAEALVARASRELALLDVPLGKPAVDQAEGVLEMAAQRWAAAAEHLLVAAEGYDGVPSPYEAAQAREQAASALFHARDERAEKTLRAALATYRKLGARWDEARCIRLGRDHGVRFSVPHRGGRKSYGDVLSPREGEVARLVAAGYTNKQIAAQLFLAPTTVEKHLGRAMPKLGVRSRAAVGARLQRGTVAGDGR